MKKIAVTTRALVAVAALVAVLCISPDAKAAIQTAGELVVDLSNADLAAGINTWVNHSTSADSVGDFTRTDSGNLTVLPALSDGNGVTANALQINTSTANALHSASTIPASLSGNGARSVEVWIYADSDAQTSAVMAWGNTSVHGGLSSFNYNQGGNGLLSGWYADASWGGATLPLGEWTYVAYTYDGTTFKGYINGVEEASASLALVTVATGVDVGVAATTRDPFRGSIGEVRVHTGVLSDSQVLNNYNEGMPVPNLGPTILGLDDQTVVVGSDVTLNPTVTGSKPITYQWKENGATMSGETNSTLTLLNVQTGQDGYVYSLIASNVYGADTNSMTLTVTETSPGVEMTINVDIDHYTTYSGTAVAPDSGTTWNSFTDLGTLNAGNVLDSQGDIADGVAIALSSDNGSHIYNDTGTGSPNPLYLMSDYTYGANYTFNITGLNAGQKFALYAYLHGNVDDQNGSVTLAGANGGDSGSTSQTGDYANFRNIDVWGEGYNWVRLVGDVDGSGNVSFNVGTYMNGFQLQLLASPVISGLTNQTVVAGSSTVLNPTISGTPPLSYQWLSNSIPLAGETSESLVLNDVQYAQDGTVYSLEVGNDAGTVTKSMTLSVIVTPSIENLNNQAVSPGSLVTIAPTVTGMPVPALQWLYNGGVVSDGATGNGSTVSGSTSETLSITNAQVADSGTYSLIASNSAGIVTNSMTLTVSSSDVPPEITGPVDQTEVQGSDATFNASVSGLPLPTLQWRSNGVDIAGATGSTVTVSNVQYAQNGDVYSLVASNRAGVFTNSATLYVLVPPTISLQPTNLAVTVGGPATFNVTASGVPDVSYQWSRDGSPIAGATNWSYSIASVQGSDNGGVFSVEVANSVDSIVSSDATLTVLSTMTGTLLPANDATGIAPDQQLRIVFSGGTPQLAYTGKKLYVYDASDDSLFATIDTSLFQTFATDSATVKNAFIRSVQGNSFYYMPIAVYGNEAWITLNSNERFEYNKTYYVTCDTGLFVDSDGASFPGITGTNTWRFSTKASGPATPTASTGPTEITVGLDGAGDFATLQGASDWIPQNNTLERTISIQPGIYHDFAVFYQGRDFVNVVGAGASRDDVQIIYPNAAFTSGSSCGMIRVESSDDLYFRNLTLDNEVYIANPLNNYGPFPGRLNVLVTKNAKRLIFDNVAIKGGQDTLYADSGIAYFNGCEVWGSTDFIYGQALAVFDQCKIVEIRASGGPVTAPHTDLAAPYGEVFLNCSFPRALVADGYPYDVAAGSSAFMRPWGQDGMTAIINCSIGSQFSTKGWSEWSGRETTCRAREYGTTLIGGGAAPTIAQRQSAGAYWLNTIDPDYVSNPSLSPTDPLLYGTAGRANRVAVTVDPADYTLSAIFGHPYYGLNGWMPATLPTITRQPTNQTVTAGSPASFTVAAQGLPEPTYQWRKDAADISDATDATFSILSSRLADSGTYTVIVSNSVGAVVSSNAVLSVPPVAVPIKPTFTNGELSLSWPVEQTGFRLLTQTNASGVGLTTNWQTVAESGATNQLTVPVNISNGSVFFRLVYP